MPDHDDAGSSAPAAGRRANYIIVIMHRFLHRLWITRRTFGGTGGYVRIACGKPRFSPAVMQ